MEPDGGLSDGAVEKESQRPASGAMAFNSASSISLVLTFWKEFDLENWRVKLDEQGMKIRENQENSLKNRRKLAESTRDFMKAANEEKVKAFPALLKGYQEEVDNLTKRAKFGENAFLNIYQKLYEAPDPTPALSSGSELAGRVAELETENRTMKQELEEYSSEAAHLRNQQATVRRLEERNRLLEQQRKEIPVPWRKQSLKKRKMGKGKGKGKQPVDPISDQGTESDGSEGSDDWMHDFDKEDGMESKVRVTMQQPQMGMPMMQGSQWPGLGMNPQMAMNAYPGMGPTSLQQAALQYQMQLQAHMMSQQAPLPSAPLPPSSDDDPDTGDEGDDPNRAARMRLRRRQMKKEAREDAIARRAKGMKPFWVKCDPSGKPIGLRRHLWGQAVRGYGGDLDPSIDNYNSQPHVALATIKRRLDENWEYISYDLNDKHFHSYLRIFIKNRRHQLKKRIDLDISKPKSCKVDHWENMRKLVERPEKIQQATALTAARAKIKNPSHSGPGGEDGVRDRLRVETAKSPTRTEINLELEKDKGSKRSRKAPASSTLSRAYEATSMLAPQANEPIGDNSPTYRTGTANCETGVFSKRMDAMEANLALILEAIRGNQNPPCAPKETQPPSPLLSGGEPSQKRVQSPPKKGLAPAFCGVQDTSNETPSVDGNEPDVALKEAFANPRVDESVRGAATKGATNADSGTESGARVHAKGKRKRKGELEKLAEGKEGPAMESEGTTVRCTPRKAKVEKVSSEEISKYSAVIFLDPSSNEIIGTGQVISGQGGTYHGRDIPQGCYTCTVLEVIKGEAKLQFPNNNSDPPQVRLMDAVDSIILWRAKSLRLTNQN